MCFCIKENDIFVMLKGSRLVKISEEEYNELSVILTELQKKEYI